MGGKARGSGGGVSAGGVRGGGGGTAADRPTAGMSGGLTTAAPVLGAWLRYGKYVVAPIARLIYGDQRSFKLLGQRVGQRAYQRAQAGATVTQLPGTKRVTVGKKPAPGTPKQPGPIATGAGYGVGATAVQIAVQQGPPLVSGAVQAVQAYRAAGVVRIPGPTQRYSAQGNPYLGPRIQRSGGAMPTAPPGYRDPSGAQLRVAVFGDPRATLARLEAEKAKAEAERRILQATLYSPKIYAKALPMPAKVAPAPWYSKAYAPLKSVGLGYLYPAIPTAIKAAPFLLPLLKQSGSKPNKRTDLTGSNLPSVSSILNPAQSVQPQQALQPMTATATAKKCKPCATKKRKKGKPRGPRTVCYSGSYTETATGLSKRKRKQVPCRSSRKSSLSARTPA